MVAASCSVIVDDMPEHTQDTGLTTREQREQLGDARWTFEAEGHLIRIGIDDCSMAPSHRECQLVKVDVTV